MIFEKNRKKLPLINKKLKHCYLRKNIPNDYVMFLYYDLSTIFAISILYLYINCIDNLLPINFVIDNCYPEFR